LLGLHRNFHHPFGATDSDDAVMQRIISARQYMLSTIDDVKTAARKVWPDAIAVDVALAPTNTRAQKMYRVSAFGKQSRLLDHLDAPSLNKLKVLLEHRVTAEARQ
jgi:hypothetical protein